MNNKNIFLSVFAVIFLGVIIFVSGAADNLIARDSIGNQELAQVRGSQNQSSADNIDTSFDTLLRILNHQVVGLRGEVELLKQATGFTDTTSTSGLTNSTPLTPRNLTATPQGSTQMNLAWVDVATNEQGFGIQRSLDGVNFNPPILVPANQTAYQDTQLSPATKYYYRVYAYNTAGNSPFSNIASATTGAGGPGGVIQGNLIEWDRVEIVFTGPQTNESANNPNPFLDYRLNVTFTHGAKHYIVPGFYNGDGNGGGTGNKWFVRFNPDEPGPWSYSASFRKGADIAVSLDPGAGTSAGFFDGATGNFTIANATGNEPGFFGMGQLRYVGKHYYETAEDQKVWIKNGANSPENFLGYEGFDNTTHHGEGILHKYAIHAIDDYPNDPLSATDCAKFKEGKCEGIIGALNNLSNNGVNSIYFLPMNIGGDAQDTHPYVDTTITWNSYPNDNDNLHFDISKLSQWEIVFPHADKRGILLHFVLNEAEKNNKRELDDATLGNERKLFYREMVARFAHHNAVQWNVSEEYDHDLPLTETQVKSFASYINGLDPYQHGIAVHNGPTNNPIGLWLADNLFGFPSLTVASIQHAGGVGGYGGFIEDFRIESANAGIKVIANADEYRSASATGVTQADHRQHITWPTFISGGGGIDLYSQKHDQSLDNFNIFKGFYNDGRRALDFMEKLGNDIQDMTPNDNLITNISGNGKQVFAKLGEVYAFYIPNATNINPKLNLTNYPNTTFSITWFNPVTGAQSGGTVQGGGIMSLGISPYSEAAGIVKRL